MLHALQSPMVESTKWLDAFILDFRTRLAALLAGAFRSFPPALALSLLDPKLSFGKEETERSIEQGGAVIHKAGGSALSPYDLKRLQVQASLAALSEHTFMHVDISRALVGLTSFRSSKAAIWLFTSCTEQSRGACSIINQAPSDVKSCMLACKVWSFILPLAPCVSLGLA